MFRLCFLGGLCGNRRMIRFPNKQEGDPGTTFTGTQENFDQSKFVPGQVKKGKYQSKLALTILGIFMYYTSKFYPINVQDSNSIYLY